MTLHPQSVALLKAIRAEAERRAFYGAFQDIQWPDPRLPRATGVLWGPTRRTRKGFIALAALIYTQEDSTVAFGVQLNEHRDGGRDYWYDRHLVRVQTVPVLSDVEGQARDIVDAVLAMFARIEVLKPRDYAKKHR